MEVAAVRARLFVNVEAESLSGTVTLFGRLPRADAAAQQGQGLAQGAQRREVFLHARQLLVSDVTCNGVPCAFEQLDPLAAIYSDEDQGGIRRGLPTMDLFLRAGLELGRRGELRVFLPSAADQQRLQRQNQMLAQGNRSSGSSSSSSNNSNNNTAANSSDSSSSSSSSSSSRPALNGGGVVADEAAARRLPLPNPTMLSLPGDRIAGGGGGLQHIPHEIRERHDDLFRSLKDLQQLNDADAAVDATGGTVAERDEEDDFEVIVLTIRYSLERPVTGLVFTDEAVAGALPTSKYAMTSYAFPLIDVDGPRCWMPCIDKPGQRALYDVRITVPSGYQVVCSGQQVSKRDLPAPSAVTASSSSTGVTAGFGAPPVAAAPSGAYPGPTSVYRFLTRGRVPVRAIGVFIGKNVASVSAHTPTPTLGLGLELMCPQCTVFPSDEQRQQYATDPGGGPAGSGGAGVGAAGRRRRGNRGGRATSSRPSSSSSSKKGLHSTQTHGEWDKQQVEPVPSRWAEFSDTSSTASGWAEEEQGGDDFEDENANETVVEAEIEVEVGTETRTRMGATPQMTTDAQLLTDFSEQFQRQSLAHVLLGLPEAVAAVHQMVGRAGSTDTFRIVVVGGLVDKFICFDGWCLVHDLVLYTRVQVDPELSSHLTLVDAYATSWALSSLSVRSDRDEWLVFGAGGYLAHLWAQNCLGENDAAYRLRRMEDAVVAQVKEVKALPLSNPSTYEAYERNLPWFWDLLRCKSTLIFRLMEERVGAPDPIKDVLQQLFRCPMINAENIPVASELPTLMRGASISSVLSGNPEGSPRGSPPPSPSRMSSPYTGGGSSAAKARAPGSGAATGSAMSFRRVWGWEKGIIREPTVTSAQFLQLLRTVSGGTGSDLTSTFSSWLESERVYFVRAGCGFDRRKKTTEVAAQLVNPFEQTTAPLADEADFDAEPSSYVTNDGGSQGDSSGVSMTVRIVELEGSWDHEVRVEKRKSVRAFQLYSRIGKGNGRVGAKSGKSKTGGGGAASSAAAAAAVGSVLGTPSLRNGGAGGGGRTPKKKDESALAVVRKQFHPLLFLRLDPNGGLIGEIVFQQSLRMWVEQLYRDHSLVAQVEALRALARRSPTDSEQEALVARALSDCLHNVPTEEGTPHGHLARAEAAYALARWQAEHRPAQSKTSISTENSFGGWLGLKSLQRAFVLGFCDGRTGLPRPNRFDDDDTYHVRKSVLHALAQLRTRQNATPTPVWKLLMQLLKYNDNTVSELDDTMFRCHILACIARLRTSPAADDTRAGEEAVRLREEALQLVGAQLHTEITLPHRMSEAVCAGRVQNGRVADTTRDPIWPAGEGAACALEALAEIDRQSGGEDRVAYIRYMSREQPILVRMAATQSVIRILVTHAAVAQDTNSLASAIAFVLDLLCAERSRRLRLFAVRALLDALQWREGCIGRMVISRGEVIACHAWPDPNGYTGNLDGAMPASLRIMAQSSTCERLGVVANRLWVAMNQSAQFDQSLRALLVAVYAQLWQTAAPPCLPMAVDKRTGGQTAGGGAVEYVNVYAGVLNGSASAATLRKLRAQLDAYVPAILRCPNPRTSVQVIEHALRFGPEPDQEHEQHKVREQQQSEYRKRGAGVGVAPVAPVANSTPVAGAGMAGRARGGPPIPRLVAVPSASFSAAAPAATAPVAAAAAAGAAAQGADAGGVAYMPPKPKAVLTASNSLSLTIPPRLGPPGHSQSTDNSVMAAAATAAGQGASAAATAGRRSRPVSATSSAEGGTAGEAMEAFPPQPPPQKRQRSIRFTVG